MQLQRYHATETIRHLLGGQQVVWMAGQSWVVHLPYGQVRGEGFRDPLATRADLPHLHRKGLDPALHQPGFLWSRRDAQHADVSADRDARLIIGGDDRAAGDTGVAAQVLKSLLLNLGVGRSPDASSGVCLASS